MLLHTLVKYGSGAASCEKGGKSGRDWTPARFRLFATSDPGFIETLSSFMCR